jgi:hypothetical protein
MLGEYRPFFGLEIGRNGPPGADYYTLPELMPLGNLLKASYLRDGNHDDILAVREAVDLQKKGYNATRLIQYGEQKLYQALFDPFGEIQAFGRFCTGRQNKTMAGDRRGEYRRYEHEVFCEGSTL